MSVAIVAMVNHTALPKQHEEIGDECGRTNETVIIYFINLFFKLKLQNVIQVILHLYHLLISFFYVLN